MRVGMGRWGCIKRMSLLRMGWACPEGCLIRERLSNNNSSNRVDSPCTLSWLEGISRDRGKLSLSLAWQLEDMEGWVVREIWADSVRDRCGNRSGLEMRMGWASANSG
jgi:hypothetical protein